jgi:hypothetical protein
VADDGPYLPLTGEEWLRRVALGRSLVVVPDAIASALIAAGLAHRFPAGTLAVTAAGRQYLEERGIATLVIHSKRT